MKHARKFFPFLLCVCIISLPVFAMESEETPLTPQISAQDERQARTEAAVRRWEEVLKKSEEQTRRQAEQDALKVAQDNLNKTTAEAQRLAALNDQIEQETARAASAINEFESLEKQVPDQNNSHQLNPQPVQIPSPHSAFDWDVENQLSNANNNASIIAPDLGNLGQELDEFFKREDIDSDVLGPITTDNSTTTESHQNLRPIENKSTDDHVMISEDNEQQAENNQPTPVAEQSQESITPSITSAESQVPQALPPINPNHQENNNQRIEEPQPVHPAPQPITEDYLAQVLNNIWTHKVPMITGGTLGLVHYLYENEILNNAVAVRSPEMKEYLHKYILPTAREALGANLIQLLLPYLPYLRSRDIRSFSSSNYIASFIATKLLGTTALYLAKMITETKQGKKLISQYKLLPKRTKETIERIAPWLEFTRNLFMARALAGYFEPAPAA